MHATAQLFSNQTAVQGFACADLQPTRRTHIPPAGELTIGGRSNAVDASAASDGLRSEDAAVQCSGVHEDGHATTMQEDVCDRIEDRGVSSPDDSISSTPTLECVQEKPGTRSSESVEETLQSSDRIVNNLYRYPLFSSLMEGTQADTEPSHAFAAPDELRFPAAQHLDGDEELFPLRDEAWRAQPEDDNTYHPSYEMPSVTWAATSPPPSEPARTMLAATLPQELLFMIVDAAGCLFRDYEDKVHAARSDLLCCALVCIEWAKRFRPLAYGGRNVVKSERSARRLRDLVMGPCSDRLTPLVDLMGELRVEANPRDKRSWHHRLTCLARIPDDKFAEIHIRGDISSWPLFRSLHWGIPSPARDLPSPYRKVTLDTLRFASVEHIFQIVRKLPRLEKLDLSYLQWAEDTPRGNTAPRQQARSVLTRVKVVFRHDVSVLLLRLLLIEGSARVANPLQVLLPPEQSAIIQLVERFTANAEDSRARFGLFAHRPTLSSRLVISHSVIVLCDYDYSSTSLHFYHEHTVIGCAVVVTHDADTDPLLSAAVVDDLWSTLALFPDLRYLIVGLSDLSSVQLLAETHQALWNSLAERLWYFCFASYRKEEQEWVAHDPVSLEMTGEKWTDEYWNATDYGADLTKIVLAQMEANCTALDHHG